MQEQCLFRLACLRSLFSKSGEQHWPFIFRIQHRLLFVEALNPSSPFEFMNRNLRYLVIGLLVAYTGLLLAGTLSPFGFRLDARSMSYFPSPEWIPFTYHDPRCPWTGFFRDKLINIVMFLPFGVLLGIIIQSGAKPEGTLLKTTVLAALFSLAIETLQYFLPQRHPTASDLLMNTFGAFLGAWLVSRGLAVLPLKLSRSS